MIQSELPKRENGQIAGSRHAVPLRRCYVLGPESEREFAVLDWMFTAMQTWERRELLKWYKARDYFLGVNDKPQDIGKGLALAKLCSHEDAKWLVTLFRADGAPVSEWEAKEVLLAQGEDARALCFAGLVCGAENRTAIESSAKLGYGLAQAKMASWIDGREGFAWAQMAAAQREPLGLHELARCFLIGEGCKEDSAKALMLFKDAADLDNAWSQFEVGARGFTESEPGRYFWWGKSAANGHFNACSWMGEAARNAKVLDGRGSSLVVFEIGAALSGHVDTATTKVFGQNLRDDSFASVQRAISLHNQWCCKAKEAIWCWILVGQRNGMGRDIRNEIARLLWANRAMWSGK